MTSISLFLFKFESGEGLNLKLCVVIKGSELMAKFRLCQSFNGSCQHLVELDIHFLFVFVHCIIFN